MMYDRRSLLKLLGGMSAGAALPGSIPSAAAQDIINWKAVTNHRNGAVTPTIGRAACPSELGRVHRAHWIRSAPGIGVAPGALRSTPRCHPDIFQER